MHLAYNGQFYTAGNASVSYSLLCSTRMNLAFLLSAYVSCSTIVLWIPNQPKEILQ